MNELPAGGWSEPNDELSFDLDREWERWNMELSDELSPEQHTDQLRLLEQYEDIKREALRKLHELDVIVVLDVDASNEAEQFTVFAEKWQNNCVEEYKRLGRELTEADERQLAIDCVVAYFEERDFQALIINAVTMYHFIAINADRPEVKASALNMDTMKKELQSELLVHRSLPMSGAWQQFVSDMVPGESLDVFDKDDQVYLVKARLTTPDFVAEKVLKKSVIEQAFELTGIDWENDDLAKVVRTVADIMNMQIIAAQPAFNETDRANRNAELWHEGRKLECDPEAVRKIIDLMDASYPVIAPPEL
jgi:hypothetical protein